MNIFMIIKIVINYLSEIPRKKCSMICPWRSVSCSLVIFLMCHSWQGEICLCTSRIFVQKSIYSEFLKRFLEATKLWKVGIPSDPSASMGALISKAHLEKVSKSLPCTSQEEFLFGEKLSARHALEYYWLLPYIWAVMTCGKLSLDTESKNVGCE